MIIYVNKSESENLVSHDAKLIWNIGRYCMVKNAQFSQGVEKNDNPTTDPTKLLVTAISGLHYYNPLINFVAPYLYFSKSSL